MAAAPETGFEQFDVEADVGIRGWGASRAEAFAQVALGVFSLIAPPEDVGEPERREVRAQGESPEALLVNWVNECLYLHEIEGFVVHRVDVLACRDSVVHGVLHGEELDRGRHRLGTVVKSATSHRVLVGEHHGVHEARIIVDV